VRRGFPDEGILVLGDVLQEFLGIGHIGCKYTICRGSQPSAWTALPDSARIVNLGRRKVRNMESHPRG
jgi:hypothetical protein